MNDIPAPYDEESRRILIAQINRQAEEIEILRRALRIAEDALGDIAEALDLPGVQVAKSADIVAD